MSKMLNHLGFLLRLAIFTTTSFFSIETVATHIFIFTNFFFLWLSDDAIVFFSYHLSNATNFKISFFTRELLVGEMWSKDIRLAKSNLLMLPLKNLILLRIQLLMVWLSTIHLTVVHGNEGDTINDLVIIFDQMLRHVT